MKPSLARAKADSLDRRERLNFNALDEGIRTYVRVLWENGVETVQSCQGGKGHSYAEPTIQFLGGPAAGPEALAIAMAHALPVSELRRVWEMQDGEPTGPTWHMTFRPKT
jgi:hypothetical protein